MNPLVLTGLLATISWAADSKMVHVQHVEFKSIQTHQSDEEASTTVTYFSDGRVTVNARHGRGYKLGGHNSGNFEVASAIEFQHFLNRIITQAMIQGLSSPPAPANSFDARAYTKVELLNKTVWVEGLGQSAAIEEPLALQPLATKKNRVFKAVFVTDLRLRQLLSSGSQATTKPVSTREVKDLVQLLLSGAEWSTRGALDWAVHLKPSDLELIRPLESIEHLQARAKALRSKNLESR